MQSHHRIPRRSVFQLGLLFRLSVVALLLLTGCSGVSVQNAMEFNSEYLDTAPRRTFAISYTALVERIPAGSALLRLWFPVPQSSSVQSIRELHFETPVEPDLTTGSKHGNRFAYFEIPNPGETFQATMHFTCTRVEIRTLLEDLQTDAAAPEGAYEVFLRPGRLVVVDDRIRGLAAQTTQGMETTLEKAKALYEYVLETMTYDKTGVGWGRGDTNYACEVGKGNCTDFHSLFISLCRACGIPSGFELGLYLPYDPLPDAEVGAYHCWAAFRVPGKTWVPVDISEADRKPDLVDYFFGNHTSNRVTLSTGRDLVLEPPQTGDPLNFLVNPYAEVDGKTLESTSKKWSYRDLD